MYDAQGRVIYWKSSDGGLEEKPSQEAWLQWNDEYNTCTAFLYAPPEHLSALEYTAYDGENILWEMEYSSDGLISYRACRYDGEQLTRELSWEKELSRSNFFYYKYDRDGRLSEKYTYRVASDKIDLELSDGSTVQWTFTLAENGNTRCPSGITRTSRSGGLLEQFAFDTDGILTDQYTKEWNELWPQDPPVSPKYTSSDEEGD